MKWYFYVLLAFYLGVFCVLLIPAQRGKKKRVVTIVKKYQNIKPNHRVRIANMVNEVNGVFMNKGVIDYNAMYRLLERMKGEKKYEGYKAQLELIIESIDSSLLNQTDENTDLTKRSYYLTVASIIVTIVIGVVSAFMEWLKG